MAMNTLAPAEMRPHARAAAQLLKALAHEERLMILCNLLEGERTAAGCGNAPACRSRRFAASGGVARRRL